MSNVIITNTTGTPIFISGKLLTAGMSMEVGEHDIPDCLRAAAQSQDPSEKTPPDATGKGVPPAPTDEELLVAAAAKGKPK